MPSLMPAPEPSLFLPVAALASPAPVAVTPGLRLWLMALQEEFLHADELSGRPAAPDLSEFRRHDGDAARELMVGAWAEALRLALLIRRAR